MRRITIFVGMLFLIIFSLQAQQQRASVSGRVTDAATGEALQGAAHLSATLQTRAKL